jgi:predicted transcriptional regulator YheO
LQIIKDIVPSLQAALGCFYEVVLHDFTDVEHSIVAISGNITGRSIGGPITNLVLSVLKAGKVEDMLGYPTTLPDGRVLKSSTIFIRDNSGKPIGCLCINLDLTAFLGAQKAIETFTEVHRDEPSGVKEDFTTDIGQLVTFMIQRSVNAIPKPVALMSKEDKLQIVRRLDEEGLFLVKGAIEAVASALSLSRATVYGYVDEVRGQRLLSSGSQTGG